MPVSSDYSSGFGGKYGVQADRVDKSAVGFDYQGKTEKHESQKGLPAARPPGGSRVGSSSRSPSSAAMSRETPLCRRSRPTCTVVAA